MYAHHELDRVVRNVYRNRSNKGKKKKKHLKSYDSVENFVQIFCLQASSTRSHRNCCCRLNSQHTLYRYVAPAIDVVYKWTIGTGSVRKSRVDETDSIAATTTKKRKI